jgi:hypothetical protein
VYTYKWIASPWGPCSKRCDGGTQTRTVTCRHHEDGLDRIDAFCNDVPKPALIQERNIFPCWQDVIFTVYMVDHGGMSSAYDVNLTNGYSKDPKHWWNAYVTGSGYRRTLPLLIDATFHMEVTWYYQARDPGWYGFYFTNIPQGWYLEIYWSRENYHWYATSTPDKPTWSVSWGTYWWTGHLGNLEVTLRLGTPPST